MTASNDGSESVDQFLARIASLSRKNEEEDADRARRTEEEMAQAREERRARRAERARSISPVKTGPAVAMSSPRPLASSPQISIEPPVTFTPRSQTQTPTRRHESQSPPTSPSIRSSPLEAARPLPPPPQDKIITPSFPSPNTSALSRSGTLSWQQRPVSRDGPSVRSRPLSGPRSVFREQNESSAVSSKIDEKPEMSRSDIAASLEARDPAWFRQTADRGTGSAAYRKSHEESSGLDSFQGKGSRLPGMASKAPEPAIPISNIAAETTKSVDRVINVVASGTSHDIVAAPAIDTTSTNTRKARPQLAAEAIPPTDESVSLGQSPSILPAAGRPPSPTKGLGGFVQSAMMKRSDSVSKRWSVQANSGLRRGDSVAGNRPKPSMQPPGPSLGQAKALTRNGWSTADNDPSSLSTSRPTSGHEMDPEIPAPEDTGSAHNVLEQSSTIPSPQSKVTPDEPSTPPSASLLSRSPSKTLDPRRWSPTKASWLESVLAKPESPLLSPTKAEVPAWKVGLERSRSQKDLPESPTRSSNFEPVSTDGLLRSPPPGSPTKTPASLASQASSQNQVQIAPIRQLMHANEAASPQSPVKSTEPSENIATGARTRPGDSQDRLQRPETSKYQQSSQSSTALPPSTTSPSTALTEPAEYIQKKPPVLKPKPATPPKNGLRSTPRSRRLDSTEDEQKEPEFRALFGKLKPTQTQNYVAPDTFKNNITQGKAALNVTGGPQKTKRVDEFKESILQRKEQMKAGGGSIHGRPDLKSQPATSQKEDAEVPEALARRNTLHRSKQSADANTGKPVIESQKSVVQVPSWKARNVNSSSNDKVTVQSEQTTSMHPAKPSSTVGKALVVNLSTAGAGSRSVSKDESTVSPTTEPVSRVMSMSPDKELTKTASNKLAARLNPALAGLIARGNSPKPAADSPPTTMVVESKARHAAPAADKDTEVDDLVHVTKGRAKGPKRRAPKAETIGVKSETPVTVNIGPRSAEKTEKANPVSIKPTNPGPDKLSVASPVFVKPLTSPKPSIMPNPAKTIPLSAAQKGGVTAANVDGAGDLAREKPAIGAKSPDLRRVSDQQQHNPKKQEVFDSKPVVQGKPFSIATDKSLHEDQAETAKAEAGSEQPQVLPLTPSKTKVNSPKKPNSAMNSPALKPTPKTGMGLDLTPKGKAFGTAARGAPAQDKSNRAQPRSKEKADNILQEFFGRIPKASERLEFDPEAFLKGQSEQPKGVRTISNKIVEVTGDGKQTALTPSQEHILYEDSMYLCVHTFDLDSSKATEVYLWAGDAVAEAAVEDAQIFCKKVARDNSTKLEVLKQGKESSRFFSALGGIVIVRKNKSSALYMLCGRRHGGHVVFDEVDFASSSLCSGFSFLISAKFGKLYLWIGSGSCADEYGAARLIGTDLGLTGEIEEIAENKEPAIFWEAFAPSNAKKEFKTSKTWSMRSGNGHNGFPCKLYRIEQERPKSSGGFWGLRASSPPKQSNKAILTEITHFSQRDLDESSVHLLDAYATIYVVPGKASPTKATDFVTALHVAQELSVLLPSMQDRALLPSCQVVFGEPSSDFKFAFRKWQGIPTGKSQAGDGDLCFDVADVMKVLE